MRDPLVLGVIVCELTTLTNTWSLNIIYHHLLPPIPTLDIFEDKVLWKMTKMETEDMH